MVDVLLYIKVLEYTCKWTSIPWFDFSKLKKYFAVSAFCIYQVTFNLWNNNSVRNRSKLSILKTIIVLQIEYIRKYCFNIWSICLPTGKKNVNRFTNILHFICNTSWKIIRHIIFDYQNTKLSFPFGIQKWTNRPLGCIQIQLTLSPTFGQHSHQITYSFPQFNLSSTQHMHIDSQRILDDTQTHKSFAFGAVDCWGVQMPAVIVHRT